jgi:hypothetical protein
MSNFERRLWLREVLLVGRWSLTSGVRVCVRVKARVKVRMRVRVRVRR